MKKNLRDCINTELQYSLTSICQIPGYPKGKEGKKAYKRYCYVLTDNIIRAIGDWLIKENVSSA